MSPVPDAEGEKINWINYKTGIKHIFFRMDAGNNSASIAIIISHPGITERHLCYEEFEAMHKVLEESLGEKWNWQADVYDESGKQVSSISTTLEGVNIFKQETWPEIISFLKPRIIALDLFWQMAKFRFE